MKMDLCLITTKSPHINDCSSVEFAKEIFESKHYRDKLKTVVAAKAYLNEFLSKHSGISSDQIPKVLFPFAIVSGFELQIFALRLTHPGLYAVDRVSDNYVSNDNYRNT
ncbi:hypothetical protein DFQ28_001147 [Apophysomyces sp. BC1034]|nr:hypothetical protein DFQ30_003747 [Apophysomyces sp. BC1015]KAG0180413.1 hypothetical protein DFQ29_000706 [Apophysomyces sp. BC1021]KAG0190983.1 hypothetical protein DFQ28_001147 [Apophysomyces sp. BC1034]